jgi:hypothetical protein
VLFSFYGVSSWYGTSNQASNPYTAHKGQNTDYRNYGESPVWHWLIHDAAGFFTLCLVIVGSGQAGLFIWQLRVMRGQLSLMREGLADAKEAADAAKLSAEVADKSLKLSRETTERQSRAYVSLKEFRKSPMVDTTSGQLVGWELSLIWQNTGATPTRDMLTHVSIRFEAGELPEAFRFPDMWIIGRQQIYAPVHLAPNGVFIDGIAQFSVEQLQEVRKGNKTLYLYGWADYNDVVLGTPRRRTEFCTRVLLPGDPSFSREANISFDIYWKHNGADDECMRQPTTTVTRETIPDLPKKP